MNKQNKPYVKELVNGIVSNPITKETPYLQSPSKKGGKKIRMSNNRKGKGMVVTKIGVLTFIRYSINKQYLKGKLIVQATLCNN